MNKIIEVNDLHKSYGKAEVLKGLNLSYEPGQIIGLLGPNSCGKTTMM